MDKRELYKKLRASKAEELGVICVYKLVSK